MIIDFHHSSLDKGPKLKRSLSAKKADAADHARPFQPFPDQPVP